LEWFHVPQTANIRAWTKWCCHAGACDKAPRNEGSIQLALLALPYGWMAREILFMCSCFATVHNTGASEAYAKLLSFICTWRDMEKDFARVLLPTRVRGMSSVCLSCSMQNQDRQLKRASERERWQTKAHMVLPKKEDMDAHDLNPITRFVPKFHVWKEE
jgi:hypothetical protein